MTSGAGSSGSKPRPAASTWCVWREDDNGNRFRMKAGLTEREARALADDFTRRGHKQRYWAEPDS